MWPVVEHPPSSVGSSVPASGPPPTPASGPEHYRRVDSFLPFIDTYAPRSLEETSTERKRQPALRGTVAAVMQIDAAQFTKIMYAVYERFEPHAEGTAKERSKLTAPEAELVVAIAQLAVAADRVEDPDERALFEQLAAHIYVHANVATTPPSLGPVEDAERRIDHLKSHAAQLQGKASAALAYAVAYILAISDMDLDPDEGLMLEILREALGLDEEKADDLLPVVSELLAPLEE